MQPDSPAPKRMVRFLLGSRSDWHLTRPRWPRLRSGLHLVGPIAVALSTLASYVAFAGATGDGGSVALGLWVGAASIILMSWSFLLAVRLRWMERFFGGLDSIYRVHRWAGTLAVVLMFLHTSIEPEIEGGIRGASRSVAETAEDLAGTGELMIYGLVALSLVRIFPYRLWRLTHKLLGIPFAFACWHFFTAEKPYANASAWGWWFGFWMIAGIVAYLARVFVRDMAARGQEFQVVAAEHSGSTTRLELKPLGRPLGHQTGQFAFLKLKTSGMSEPHPFTIASSPHRTNLVFYIRHLGDWSQRLTTLHLIGTRATLEGPYGQFQPHSPDHEPSLWIAGGVGITPFLAALDTDEPILQRPTLLYAVRSVENNPIVDLLMDAERQGRVKLRIFTSETGRLTPAALDEEFPNGLAGVHVALCGPNGLVTSMADAAAARGAAAIETEDFDIRQGFGPERSTEIDSVLKRGLQRTQVVLSQAD